MQPEQAPGSATLRVARGRLLVASLVLALVPGWWLAAGWVGHQVAVSWAGPPRCVGAEYVPVRGMGPPPAIHARRGFRCTITVVVRNDGFRPVHLDRLVAPYVGRRGGGVVAADPQPPATDQPWRDGETDAHIVIDRELRAGETHRATITLGFRERGCSAARTTFSNFPTLRVNALGRTGVEVTGVEDLVFIQDGPSSRCPAP
jgi:hypothetical protein